MMLISYLCFVKLISTFLLCHMKLPIATPVVLSLSFKDFATLGVDKTEKQWCLYALPFVSKAFQGCGDSCEIGISHRLVTDLLFSVNEKLVFIHSPSKLYTTYKSLLQAVLYNKDCCFYVSGAKMA